VKEAVGRESPPASPSLHEVSAKKLTRLVSGLTLSGVSDADAALSIQLTNGSKPFWTSDTSSIRVLVDGV
jgi:hypothetical protein